jgi:hypothetical protein
MSPLQAAHVFQGLVTVKFDDPNFEVTPAEWKVSLEKAREAAKHANPKGEYGFLGNMKR